MVRKPIQFAVFKVAWCLATINASALANCSLTTKCGFVFETFHSERAKNEVRLSVYSDSSALQRSNFEVSS